MYAICHRASGMFWLDTRAFSNDLVRCGSGWSLDPARARRFDSREDAEHAAFLECTSPFSELEAIEVPDVKMAVSA